MGLQRKPRPWLAIAGLSFHLLAQVFLRIPFPSLWLCYIALIDWQPLLQRLRRRDVARSSDREVLGEQQLPVIILGCALLLASTSAGARNAMQAWPFACYPTFQWTVGSVISDLRIEAVTSDGTRALVPDGPSAGRARSNARWGTAWQLLGLYGKPPSAAGMRAYYRSIAHDSRVRAATRQAASLRFYHARFSVLPERFGAPPIKQKLLYEWKLDTSTR